MKRLSSGASFNLTLMHKTFFISDLHLTPSRPDITACFLEFMRYEAIHCDALYVLGDLFDFWVGDDDNSPFAVQIRSAFKALTSSGVPCYFIQGNRDFLLGKRFARQTGVTVLPEEYVIELYGRRAVILHGDTLCIEDYSYQAFRKKVHQPWLQFIFNRLPMFIKRKIVAQIQSDARSDKQTKQLEIMDVTPSEVVRVMQKHDVELMIHGHTHRPNIHTDSAHQQTRIVLGDWYDQGSLLVVTPDDYYLDTRDFAL